MQSVFHIAFLRGLFTPDAFKGVTMSNLDGMELQMLQNVSEETKRMIDWIERDVAAALALGYVHRLHFVVSKDMAGKELIEQYSYTFKYADDGTHLLSPGQGSIVHHRDSLESCRQSSEV